MAKYKIIPSIVTTHERDYLNQARDVLDLGVKEVALFPTTINYPEREKIYKLLKGKVVIPHVHLRDDMTRREIDYLTNKFKTKLFNTHCDYIDLFGRWEEKYKSLIYIENNGILPENFLEIVGGFAGLCFDASHFEDEWRGQKRLDEKQLADNIEKMEIGCCHVNAIIPGSEKYADRKWRSLHRFNKLSDLDYLKKYIHLLSEIISLELENPISEQLQARDYIEKMIKNSQN
jgi:hypothetical protein